MTPKPTSDGQLAKRAPHANAKSGGETAERAERARIRELTQQALDAFRRDLPQLMQDGKWKWEAYHGDSQIAWGKTQLELYQECYRKGLKDDEFMIRSVEPEWCEFVVAPEQDKL